MKTLATCHLSVVAALVLTTSSLAASERQSHQTEKLEGYAEWWLDQDPEVLVVDGQRVRPAASMKFEGEGLAFDFESIPLGYEVKVKGVRSADGTVIARELSAKPNRNAFFESELRQSFDQMEADFRRRGRVHFSGQDVGKLWQAGPDVERVREIATRLSPPYLEADSFRVYVIENKEWNAMAAPNRSIYVFRGLLEDMDDDEVAIVLGHELAHVTHEHSRRQFKRSLFLSALSGGALAAAEGIGNDGARIAAKGAAIAGTLAWVNGYGRAHEDQADRVGLRYAREAGYDVYKGPALWERFAKKYGSLSKAVNFFLGNHSVAKDRSENLKRELELNYSSRP